ncbi:MAG: guanylate kinase, partial [Actinobacteria bacterium]|nr:guanylate kinase [Actinomycetota bacterium]
MSGPSGVGKGSVVRLLLSRDPRLVFSVSATTRPPRPGEEGGRDYVFLSEEEFLRLVGRGAFLEHAEVFGNRYGTLAGPVDEARRSGRDVVLDVDVQGARAVRERAPDAVLVFLVPPSLEELARRLRVRATEDRAEVARRLARAEAEMAEASRFDHVVVNDDLFRAADEI